MGAFDLCRLRAHGAAEQDFADTRTARLQSRLDIDAHQQSGDSRHGRGGEARARRAAQSAAYTGTRHVATLNGTLCSTNRPIIAMLETHQQEDGSVRVPEALRPYLGGLEVLKPVHDGRSAS